jgi:type III restriction enzyme
LSYIVDRVIICDAYSEPDKHYRLLPGGKAMLVEGRRPSIRMLATAKEMKGGIEGILGKQTALLVEDMGVTEEHRNDFVNDLRDELRNWRNGSPAYTGTSNVTRRLLEWWFERDEERKAERKRFFFCQREAVEAVIYLYEVKNKQKMLEPGDLLRYALKMATGTGKTIVMAMLITWATLHKAKVSNSSLSSNFLVITPNITVKDRVSGHPRGDGLDPGGAQNLYGAFDMVPPEYQEIFHPDVIVGNWQGMVNEPERDDWIPDEFEEEGSFVPASVLLALRRRQKRSNQNSVRHIIGDWKDVILINDEAHHVYGEKKVSKGKEPDYIRWTQIVERISKSAKVPLVVDLSATPWYGSGSMKPVGTLFEWLISDFSVYDAFESGLIKIVRLPEEEGKGRIYLDLWEMVKGAKTRDDYLSQCRGAVEHIYSSWKEDFKEWEKQPASTRGSPPAMLIVADNATKAKWVFEYVTRDLELLRNPPDTDPESWVTIQVDSKVFEAEKGNEAVLRGMVNTVGIPGRPGENVRCIVSVNMLSEGWDVKTVTHILGIRRFGSPLLTEQVIGRGLRRTNYDVLNQPLAERPDGYQETVDAFGIPFVGFPVERRKRPMTGEWGHKPVWIQSEKDRGQYKIVVPNVRSWALGATQPLAEAINISSLPRTIIDLAGTPPEVRVRPVLGSEMESIETYDEFRSEFPLMKSAFRIATELHDRTNPTQGNELPIGPVFDELIDVVLRYLDTGLEAIPPSDVRDVGIPFWRGKVINILETAIRSAAQNGIHGIPILGDPEWLDTTSLRRFQWTGVTYPGKKTHANLVACHNDFEQSFAMFLDGAKDVKSYVKNERLGFSLTYYEGSRPRQYYPDFIVLLEENGQAVNWLVETKGEIRPNTIIKSEAAELWCKKMSGRTYGEWRYLMVQQRDFEHAINRGFKTFSALWKLTKVRAESGTLGR